MILSPYPQKVINSALLFLQVRVLIFLQRSQFQQCQFCLRMEGKISSAWTASSTVIHHHPRLANGLHINFCVNLLNFCVA